MRNDLMEWREAKGLTPEQLAFKLSVSVRTIYRIESGATANPRMSLRVGLAKTLGRSLDDVNRSIRGDALNGQAVNNLGLLVALEQGAAEFRTWEAVVVPGLLQTERYARVVQGLGPVPVSPDELAKRVSLRMERQKVLDRLRLFALIDQSVLTRVTGGPDVMAEQIDHMRQLCERPNVAIRVVEGEQAHMAGVGKFSLLTSPGAEVPFTVITEDLSDAHLIGNLTVVQAHLRLWTYLWEGSRDLQEIEL